MFLKAIAMSKRTQSQEMIKIGIGGNFTLSQNLWIELQVLKGHKWLTPL
jgi:hypothetical protein